MADRPDPLTADQIAEGLRGLPEWALVDGAIRRTVTAPSFLAGIELVRQVAEVAEGMDHHPDIDIRWRRVTFTLSTHDAGGLTFLDLEQARLVDGLVADLTAAHGA
ncbi:4a-hydroxytetrahydrobiopterin dehydratase [Frankia sp. CNm7]|uniref:Putative pterin-4-alpha-carbinolamine dehydratase n=1 Tax=Frankia nepalensis TaxID=1836974 RepID=A0A937UV92_9ACTN|nr:4a-hydroxytetrahydrobiopterin dehydratase [Frankia nepalensis]MBL7494994.1 4a-hydroxytetrahydrobiopterin dehydratase [Frankia nepalensis]MBL7514695.1 4a-hydroxytetrahydrobiopterin dehydratase [Frankia nepalensis]MBL7521958.1 4a-hydroxytetrahydrobiopterin dehydratase [Frankia nepalensis]MBL7631996.1 4a-hydroxytetrahydrobiopterin dehydratase [Frankia nepalensis]